jgi:hypothetical protein
MSVGLHLSEFKCEGGKMRVRRSVSDQKCSE